jgi:hypothetical protein
LSVAVMGGSFIVFGGNCWSGGPAVRLLVLLGCVRSGGQRRSPFGGPALVLRAGDEVLWP